MNDDRMKRLFACLSEDAVGRTPACPRLVDLAGWVDGRLDEARSARIEAHLADCAHCLGQVRFLVRSDAEVMRPAASAPIARTSPIEALREAGRRWLSPPRRPALAALAVAASLLVAVVLTVQKSDWGAPAARDTGGGIDAAEPAPQRAVRNHRPPSGAAGDERPTVVSPREGSRVPREALVVAWKPVPEALSYSVRLVDAAGALLWQDETEAISTTVPAEVELVPGERYYAWVSVNLRSGLKQRARAVEFGIARE